MDKMISAVMLSWKRPDNVYKIVGELKKISIIDDIVIWNNNPEEKLLPLDSIPDVRVIRPNYNFGMNVRWHASLLAKHPTIYMQDDDIIVSESGINTLYEMWKRDPNIICGAYGRNPRLNSYNLINIYPKAEMILTSCMIFKREYANTVLALLANTNRDMYDRINSNGEDIFFSYVVMSLTRKRNQAIDISDAIECLPAPHALYAKTGHVDQRTAVMTYCRKRFHIHTAADFLFYPLIKIKLHHPAVYNKLKSVALRFLNRKA